MKIPAIKAQIGTWIYYTSVLSFKQVSEYVKKIDNELHKSNFLKDLLQRSITENYKSIAHYIETQDDRFFNALILAVYDGEPKWHDVRLNSNEIDEYIGLGVLELSGDEKIFPIDGQHRVEGIKKVMRDSDKYSDEQIPVVFIGHRTTNEGMQKARRLFSTLNRYAKPVSMRDIIALDEDDAVAIASRDLIDNHPLFSNERILDYKTKAIPESNKTAFTTIITFYECNRILLSQFLSDKIVKNTDNKKVSGNTKVKEYIKIRPDDSEVNEFIDLCNEYWEGMASSFESISKYVSLPPNADPFRNKDGGIILFRPAALIPFTKAAVRVKNSLKCCFSELFKTFPCELLTLDQTIWHHVLWNPAKKTMVMNNQALTEIIILYFWHKELLTNKEIDKMFKELQNLNQLSDQDDVDQIVESVVKNG